MEASKRDAQINPKKKETLETAYDAIEQRIADLRKAKNEAREAQPMVDLVDIKVL